ncbi:MAG: 6-phosphogluconolactonase [Polyangiaceae bacterium]|nr:6-phosphogluconolactonase [Polyangiaceae bacterium]
MPEIVRVADAGELAVRASQLMRECIDQAIATRGVARVALSGGSTPGAAYRLLGQSALDAERCRWFFVDERCVPPDSERSNYRAAKRDLFDALPVAHVFRMQGEAGAQAGARHYAELLAREVPCFDLVVAGIGDDGHTASLFPGTGAVRDPALVVAVEPGGGLEPRISLGRSTLLAARRIVILVTGAAKQPALAQALTAGDEDAVPARIYLRAESATLIADEAALTPR